MVRHRTFYALLLFLADLRNLETSMVFGRILGETPALPCGQTEHENERI